MEMYKTRVQTYTVLVPRCLVLGTTADILPFDLRDNIIII